MKSIGLKILISCILTVGISLFALGTFACVMTYNTTSSIAQESMSAATLVASERAEW